jgi:hypothetical protein
MMLRRPPPDIEYRQRIDSSSPKGYAEHSNDVRFYAELCSLDNPNEFQLILKESLEKKLKKEAARVLAALKVDSKLPRLLDCAIIPLPSKQENENVIQGICY